MTFFREHPPSPASPACSLPPSPRSSSRFAAAPADQAAAAGGYTSSSYNECPATAPYYKVSYTGYAVCSRYP